MKLREIVDWLVEKGENISFVGNADIEIVGFSSLKNCKDFEITWVKTRKTFDMYDRFPVDACAVVQEGLNLEIQSLNNS